MINKDAWEVETAVKQLRPQAFFVLENNQIVQWYDPNGSHPPTTKEIEEYLNSIHSNNFQLSLDQLYSNGKSLEAELNETTFSKKRIKICKQCEHLIKKITVCKKCFCYMPWKTKIEHSTCPLNKW